jgi:hypothetical protein
MRPTEQQIQKTIIAHLKHRQAPNVWWCAIPNGDFRRPIEAKILQSQGVRAGAPDLMFVKAGHAYFLELKAENGRARVRRSSKPSMQFARPVASLQSPIASTPQFACSKAGTFARARIMSHPEQLDRRLVFLARAAARHILVESGEMDPEEAVEGLVELFDELRNRPVCWCQRWPLAAQWERQYPPRKHRRGRA